MADSFIDREAVVEDEYNTDYRTREDAVVHAHIGARDWPNGRPELDYGPLPDWA